MNTRVSVWQGYEAGSSLTLLQRTTDTICTLLQGAHRPSLAAIQPLLPIAVRSLDSSDARCICNALVALNWVILEEDPVRIQAVFDLGVAPKLVQLMQSAYITVVVSAEKVVENLTGGTKAHVKGLVDLGLLPLLRQPCSPALPGLVSCSMSRWTGLPCRRLRKRQRPLTRMTRTHMTRTHN